MTIDLRYWEPNGTEQTVSGITGADQVESIADELLDRYGKTVTTIPGLELGRSEKIDTAASLFVCVTPESGP